MSGPASRLPGACEGLPDDLAPEGRPRGDRSCKRSEDYSGPYRVRPSTGAPPVYGPACTPCYRPLRDALLADLDPFQHDAVTSTAAAARDRRARRLGKDAGPDAPDRLRRPEGRIEAPPRARGHVHAQGRGRARVPHRAARSRRPHHRGHVPRDCARPAAAPRDRAQPRGPASARTQGAPARAAHGRPGRRSRRLRDRRRRGRDRVGEGSPRSPRPTTKPRPRRPGAVRHAAPGEVAQLYARYEAEKRTRHLIDFDDVLSRCADSIAHDEEFAAGQRWRFRHLFVDEFQDATPLQLRLVRAWLGGSGDLTVVGDPAQAIYGFTGADAAALITFERSFPGGHTIVLGRNYRSTPAVVALAEVALGSGGRRRRAAARKRCAPTARRRRSPATTTRTRKRTPSPTRAGRTTRPACRGTAWPCSFARTRSRRASRPRSPAAASRSASATGSASRRGPRCARSSTNSATRNASSPGVRSRTNSPTSRPTTNARPARRRAEQTVSEAQRAATEEARSYRDALLELGRDYLEAVGGVGGVAEFTTWLDTVTGAGATGATGPRIERDARRRPGHVPPGQGPRVVGRVRHGPRARPRTDLVVDLRGDAGRGTASAARRAEPGRGRAALLVGAVAVGRDPPRPARTVAVARAAWRTKRTTHRTACCRAGARRATTSSICARHSTPRSAPEPPPDRAHRLNR